MMHVNVRVAIPGRFSAIFISCQHAHTRSASHLPLQADFPADFTTAYVYTDAGFFFLLSLMKWIQGVKYLSREGILNLNDLLPHHLITFPA